MNLSCFRFDGPYKMDQIANRDEAHWLFDFTPSTALEIKGSKEVVVRSTSKYKVRATLVLCCLANGYKFPPLLIWKKGAGSLPKKIQDAYDSPKSDWKQISKIGIIIMVFVPLFISHFKFTLKRKIIFYPRNKIQSYYIRIIWHNFLY